MVTFDQYTNDILAQIVKSYDVIWNLRDKPGDLEILKKEWLKITGLLRVIIKKINTLENNSDSYLDLVSRLNYYLENYDFEREIDIMAPLYSTDINRIKNIRYKIIESFDDKKLIEQIRKIIDGL